MSDIISPYFRPISQTASKYARLYARRSKGVYSKFHGYAYDGVWVVARALHQIIEQNGGNYSLSDFQGERLHAALNDTNFLGVTVSVGGSGSGLGTSAILSFH